MISLSHHCIVNSEGEYNADLQFEQSHDGSAEEENDGLDEELEESDSDLADIPSKPQRVRQSPYSPTCHIQHFCVSLPSARPTQSESVRGRAPSWAASRTPKTLK